MKIKKFNFFWISSLFSWANTFKTQEFQPKIKNFQQHSNFSTTFILKMFKKYVPSTYHENKGFFFVFRNSFRWQTPLKFNNYDQKLKFSNNNKLFCITVILRKFN